MSSSSSSSFTDRYDPRVRAQRQKLQQESQQNEVENASRIERQQAKRKFHVAVAQKDVSSKATKTKLAQLKDAILETAGANPLEDPARTAQDISKSRLEGDKSLVVKKPKPPLMLPVFAPFDSDKVGQFFW